MLPVWLFLFLALVSPAFSGSTVITCQNVNEGAMEIEGGNIWDTAQRVYEETSLAELSRFYGPTKLLTQGSESSVYQVEKHPEILILYPRSLTDVDRVSKTYRSARDLAESLKGSPGEPHVMQVAALKEPTGKLVTHLIVKRAENGSVADLLDSQALPNLVGPTASARVQLTQLRGIAVALRELHARDKVHGDVKPGNIFVDKDGTFKLGDLGSAAETNSSTGAWTWLYADPLKREGGPKTVRTDCYGLSMVAYELALGQRLSKLMDGGKVDKIILTAGKVRLGFKPPIEIDSRISPVVSKLALDLNTATDMEESIAWIDAALSRLP